MEFCCDYVRIDDKGIDLLRNQFSYRHIDFSTIRSTKIYNGYLLQNRWISLMAGIFFVAVASKLLSPEIEMFKEIPNSSASLYGRGVAWLLFIPIVLISLGSYFIIQSFKKSKILRIVTESGHCTIRIKEFEKADKIQDLIAFLDNKLLQRVENVVR